MARTRRATGEPTPAALPPERRTVGQLVAESIRFVRLPLREGAASRPRRRGSEPGVARAREGGDDGDARPCGAALHPRLRLRVAARRRSRTAGSGAFVDRRARGGDARLRAGRAPLPVVRAGRSPLARARRALRPGGDPRERLVRRLPAPRSQARPCRLPARGRVARDPRDPLRPRPPRPRAAARVAGRQHGARGRLPRGRGHRAAPLPRRGDPVRGPGRSATLAGARKGATCRPT